MENPKFENPKEKFDFMDRELIEALLNIPESGEMREGTLRFLSSHLEYIRESGAYSRTDATMKIAEIYWQGDWPEKCAEELNELFTQAFEEKNYELCQRVIRKLEEFKNKDIPEYADDYELHLSWMRENLENK